MELTIKLLDAQCAPEKKYIHDAGLDVKARVPHLISVSQFATVKVPTGICAVIPPDHMGLLLPRSGHASQGIVVESPPIDAGYTGEITAIVTNNSSTPYHINPYERIAQLVIVPIATVTKINIVNELNPTPRGDAGFGSTGK